MRKSLAKPNAARQPAVMGETDHRPIPTADDVAQLAGVSKSAVSRAFTPGASVSARTRKRVEDAASRLGYRPNPIARSLSTRRSAIVGVAMAFMDQVYAPMLTRLSQRLTEEGLRLLLFKADPADIADRELETILQYNVDALLLVSVKTSDAFAARCRRSGIPLILVNPTLAAHPMSTVTGANEAGGRALGEYLIRGGHRRFAFLAGFDGSPTSRGRYTGYVEALGEAGIAAPAYDIGNYTYEEALPAARRLLALPDLPDAIFCANDSMACATIDVARREYGLAIGSQLSVVGFDNEPIAAWPLFDITTYSLPIQPLVDGLIDVMQRMWRDPEDYVDLTVSGDLIARSSARRPPERG